MHSESSPLTPPQKRWEHPPRLPPETDRALGDFAPILRQVLYNRGYRTARDAQHFLDAVPPHETDPFLLKGMEEAVAVVQGALAEGTLVAVYGDYDADGVTATALLVQVIEGLGGAVRPYIPNRFDEGYGLNLDALRALHAEGVGVVVAVDCGIRSLAEAELARDLGMDLIVVDHHHPGAALPCARAVVNPRQPGDPYPEKDLAGVGLAYKLAGALLSRFPEAPVEAEDFLDLVALGTVADLVPLAGENRALVRQGIDRMRRPQRQGLLSLMGVSGVNPRELTAGHIGFILGPRLNAAGRLDTALTALDLLLERDLRAAGMLAQTLDNHNRVRQRLTRETRARAEEIALADDPEGLLLIAVDEGFNPGVVGLAASRLTDRFYRPAIVATRDEAYTRGSCRSIPEFHITEALDRCAGLLEHYGGHAAAAGFTAPNESIPALKAKLREIAREALDGLELARTERVDAEVPLADLDRELLRDLRWLEPTGMGNPEVKLVTRGVRVLQARGVGQNGAHLKMTVAQGDHAMDAIAFRQGDWVGRLPSHIDVLYAFEENVYQGRSRLQLNVKDLRPAAPHP